MNVTQRINRVLFILSYVSQNQGIAVEDLAARVALRPRQLIKELEFMLLIGKPPFQPDDYVDIYVDDNQVFVEFDQMLNRPLRFTRAEAIALLMSLQVLDPEVDPETIRSLRDKIRRAIAKSVDATSVPTDQILFEKSSGPTSRQFAVLRQAIENNRKVQIDYYSLTSNSTARRTVRPYFLTKSLGYWYLTGYCELRKDLRTFKYERILSVVSLRSKFSAPKDLDVERYKRSFLQLMGKHQVEIQFDEPVAPWIREQWAGSVRETSGRGVILSLSTETLEFPSRLVLSHAPHAHPISPPELLEKVQEDALNIAALYATQPAH